MMKRMLSFLLALVMLVSAAGIMEVGAAAAKPQAQVSASATYQFRLAKNKFLFNGKVFTPKVVVKDTRGNVLTQGKHYYVKYSAGRKAIGVYAVKVQVKNGPGKVLYFVILPNQTTGLKLAGRTKNALAFIWTPQAGATGYVVQKYAVTKQKWVNWAVGKGAGNNGYMQPNLKPGSTHFFRVLTFKVIKGKTYYGKPSKAIKLKTLSAVSTRFKLYIDETNAKAWTVLTWQPVSGVSGYQVQYGVKAGTFGAGTDEAWFPMNNTNVVKGAGNYAHKVFIPYASSIPYNMARVRTYTIVNGKASYGKWSGRIYLDLNNKIYV